MNMLALLLMFLAAIVGMAAGLYLLSLPLSVGVPVQTPCGIP